MYEKENEYLQDVDSSPAAEKKRKIIEK